MGPRDVLDVVLDDPELRLEMALTTELIIAANQSAGRLSQHDVDRLLALQTAA